MKYWQIFWEISLIVSGAAFAVITAIVTVRGFHDLRSMFRGLLKQQEESPDERSRHL
jgi:hypothetical protein